MHPRSSARMRRIVAIALAAVALLAVAGPARADGTNHITVHAVGDRNASTGEPTPLPGATLTAFTDAALGNSVDSCTTDASGTCEISVFSPGTYWVAPTGVAGGGAFAVVDHVTTSTAGTVAYAEPVVVGEGNGSTRPFAFRRANPPMPDRCGTQIALVFDLSSSVSNGEASEIKTHAKAFIHALSGTPTSISIQSFASTAPAAGNTDLAFTSLATTSGVEAVKNAIDALIPASGSDGYTNWDAALRAVAPNADVAVVLTDGNPTVHGVPTIAPPVITGLAQIEAGVASSNAVKARGTRVIAVGIGDVTDIAEPNLRAISGPVNGSDYMITTFTELGGVFRRLADELCGGTIVVRKQVVGAPGVTGAGWRFTAGPDATPSSAVTDESGAATFRVRAFDPVSGRKVVRIAEEPVPGFVLDRTSGTNAVCTDSAGNRVPTRDVVDGITLELALASAVTCHFVNSRVLEAPEPVVAPPPFAG